MGCPEWKNSIPTLGGIRKTSLAFGRHVYYNKGNLKSIETSLSIWNLESSYKLLRKVVFHFFLNLSLKHRVKLKQNMKTENTFEYCRLSMKVKKLITKLTKDLITKVEFLVKARFKIYVLQIRIVSQIKDCQGQVRAEKLNKVVNF